MFKTINRTLILAFFKEYNRPLLFISACILLSIVYIALAKYKVSLQSNEFVIPHESNQFYITNPVTEKQEVITVTTVLIGGCEYNLFYDHKGNIIMSLPLRDCRQHFYHQTPPNDE